MEVDLEYKSEVVKSCNISILNEELVQAMSSEKNIPTSFEDNHEDTEFEETKHVKTKEYLHSKENISSSNGLPDLKSLLITSDDDGDGEVVNNNYISQIHDQDPCESNEIIGGENCQITHINSFNNDAAPPDEDDFSKNCNGYDRNDKIKTFSGDPFDKDESPKQICPKKLWNTDLPSDNEIKAARRLIRLSSSSSDLSSDSTTDGDSKEWCDILFRKRKTTRTGKVDLTKLTVKVKIPSVIPTRIRKPTERLHDNNDIRTKQKINSILQSKYLTELEEGINIDIVKENLLRLKRIYRDKYNKGCNSSRTKRSRNLKRELNDTNVTQADKTDNSALFPTNSKEVYKDSKNRQTTDTVEENLSKTIGNSIYQNVDASTLTTNSGKTQTKKQERNKVLSLMTSEIRRKHIEADIRRSKRLKRINEAIKNKMETNEIGNAIEEYRVESKRNTRVEEAAKDIRFGDIKLKHNLVTSEHNSYKTPNHPKPRIHKNEVRVLEQNKRLRKFSKETAVTENEGNVKRTPKRDDVDRSPSPKRTRSVANARKLSLRCTPARNAAKLGKTFRVKSKIRRF